MTFSRPLRLTYIIIPSCVSGYQQRCGFTEIKGKPKKSNIQKPTAIPYGDCWNWERWNIEACWGLFAIFCIEAEAGNRAAILFEQCNPTMPWSFRMYSVNFGKSSEKIGRRSCKKTIIGKWIPFVFRGHKSWQKGTRKEEWDLRAGENSLCIGEEV